MSNKLVGPSFKDIAARYKTTGGAVNLLSGKIKHGGQGAWGAIAMPAQALNAAESAQVAQWLMGGMLPYEVSKLEIVLFPTLNFLCPIESSQLVFKSVCIEGVHHGTS